MEVMCKHGEMASLPALLVEWLMNLKGENMKLISLAMLFAITGCSTMHATSMRVGRIAPAKAAGCNVRFENLTFQQASAKYEQVGMVTLSGTSTQPQAWKGETKEKLWPKVCEIGGSVVTPNAMAGGETVMGIGTGSIQFSVWNKKSM